MLNIYKVDKTKISLNIDTNYIYICSPCYNYINSDKLKKLFRISKKPSNIIKRNRMNCIELYKKQNEYTKCIVCKRCVSNILNGPDIITFLDNHILNKQVNDEILLKLTKYSQWMYNNVYDYFNNNLVQRYNITRDDYRNINQAINNLDGLPQVNIINSRAADLYNYLTKENITNTIDDL